MAPNDPDQSDNRICNGHDESGQNAPLKNCNETNNGSGYFTPLSKSRTPSNGSRSPGSASDRVTPRRGYTTAVLAAREAHRPSRTGCQPYARSTVQDQNWRSWSEVKVRVRDLPERYHNTWEVYNLFHRYANIRYIKVEMWESSRNALVIFSTAPSGPFWQTNIRVEVSKYYSHRLQLELLQPSPPRLRVSPVEPSRYFPERISIDAESLELGFMQNEKSMVAMQKIPNDVFQPAHEHIRLSLDLTSDRKRLDLEFRATSDNIPRMYGLQVPLTSVTQILHQDQEGASYLLVSLKDPPKYVRRLHPDRVRATHRSTEWKEWPAMWERQTDIDVDMSDRDKVPISLVRANPVIDTGRWLTWRLKLARTDRNKDTYDGFHLALSDHNTRITNIPDLTVETRKEAVVWRWLDPHKASHESDLHQMQDDILHLDFDIRYQLEVCISHHRLNEFSMTKAFIHKLSSLDKATAQMLLENVADSKQTFNDPMNIFTTGELRSSRMRRLPQGCVLMHSITFTPTTLHVWTPTVEISNRVIRDHITLADRFLRVRFNDEDCYGGLFPSHNGVSQDDVYERIRRAFTNGIDIAGRHYEFLASGNSQFRDKGAYFFASTPQVTAAAIRESLGKFDIINIVAKYAARIGQCFSTTRAITHVRNVNVQIIPDIKRNGFCFTDGVGKISPFVAQMIADQFRINSSPEDFPSLFQFRMGGCKGVLAVDPSLKGIVVQIRPSQKKFETATEGLEIVQVSTYQSSFLNQQIILVLDALGVPKQVFIDKMAAELKSIDISMSDEEAAFLHLQKCVDYNQTTLAMASMILDGFMTTQEPFFMSLMQLWHAWCIKALKEKARITIDQGVFLLGCVDETNTLKMDKCELPEIFVQIPDPENKGSYKAVEKICIIARNPSLHPGDVRVVRAVKCDELRHLKNVVVLPQQGERDLANMCSGGDLDGDDYLVMWDEEIIPPQRSWNRPPMDYTAPTPVMAIGKVDVKQMNDFFINYIKKDNLAQIAINHRAFADQFDQAGGVSNPICLRLAQHHSRAVDFMKTGVPAEPEDDSYPRKFPHWMINKPVHQQYKSKAVLGLLYDQVERVDFRYLQDRAFDQRILNAYKLDKDLLEAVKALKNDYDADMRRIMAQHGIGTEFEVWTAFVLAHSREKNDYKYAEEMGRLSAALQSHYRDLCLEKAGLNRLDKDLAKIGPLVAAMYTVTANENAGVNELGILIPDLEESSGSEHSFSTESELFARTGKAVPLISFPWIFASDLGRVAMKDQPVRPRLTLATGPDPINKKLRAQHYTSGLMDPEIKDRMPGPLREFELPELDTNAFAAANAYRKSNEVDASAASHTGISASVEQSATTDNPKVLYPTEPFSFTQLREALTPVDVAQSQKGYVALEEMDSGGPSDSSNGVASPITSTSSELDDTIIADEQGRYESHVKVSDTSNWDGEKGEEKGKDESLLEAGKKIAKSPWDDFVAMQGF